MFIPRTLELFVESLITKTMKITIMKNARTLSPHHMYVFNAILFMKYFCMKFLKIYYVNI